MAALYIYTYIYIRIDSRPVPDLALNTRTSHQNVIFTYVCEIHTSKVKELNYIACQSIDYMKIKELTYVLNVKDLTSI